jgi:hypothetical protein
VAFSTNKNSGFITTLFYQISLCSDISHERMILHGYELYYDGYLRGKGYQQKYNICADHYPQDQ